MTLEQRSASVVTRTRGWLWMTFVYDRMWQPAQWATRAWVKTRGYPLPWLLRGHFVATSRRRDSDEVDTCLTSYCITPLGVLWEAWRMHRMGFYVRLGLSR